MAGHGEAPARIERHPVRAWLASAIRSRAFVSAGLDEDFSAGAGGPFADAVAPDLREIKAPLRPNRSFHPAIAGADFFQFRPFGDNAVDGRVKPLNFERHGGGASLDG